MIYTVFLFFLMGMSPNIPQRRLCQIKVTFEEICPQSIAKYGAENPLTSNTNMKPALACTAQNLHFVDVFCYH